MRNLFRSGAVFFIVAGILFLKPAITTVRDLMTDNGSAVSSGGAAAIGVVMLVLGMVIRCKYTK